MDSTSDFGSASRGSNPLGGTNMAEIRLYTTSVPKKKEGSISVTAHLEPEDDGTHEKVIAQAKVDGFILPPGTRIEIGGSAFTPEQEARIRQIVRSMLPDQG